MSDSFSLITSLVTAFGLALVFGYLAEKYLKTPALVGYIIAGVAVGLIPGLPAVDVGMTEQLAEVGVMLLMFGVGLHFSVADLNKVRGVAIVGAVSQMVLASALGTLFAVTVWDWNVGSAVVFGLCLSCASTVVVTKALEIRRLTFNMSGQVAIGWLVVQDLVTVFIMVCLPPFAQVIHGEPGVTGTQVAVDLVRTLAGVVLFVVLMLVAGRKIFPEILRRVAMTGSRELFTLGVLACAIGIAYGAGAIFNVSYALGAFFAGMVMQESRYAHRAAKNSLPLQDAFAVLFFVSVGMMLDWHIFIEQPHEVLSVVLIIMGVTTSVSFALVVLLKWPLDVALVLAACVAQIGEFSYILAAQGISLKLADTHMLSLIVAASILTIALNPAMFSIIPKVRNRLVTRYGWAKRAAMRRVPMAELPADTPREWLTGQVIVAGYNEMVPGCLTALSAARRRTILVCGAQDQLDDVVETTKTRVIAGDATDPMVLVQAHVATAAVLVLPLGDSILARKVIDLARELNNRIRVVVRVPTAEEALLFEKDEGVTVVSDEVARSAAFTMAAIASLAQSDAKSTDAKAVRKDESAGDDEDDDDEDDGDYDTTADSADGAESDVESASSEGRARVECREVRRFRRLEHFASVMRQAVRGRAGEPEVSDAPAGNEKTEAAVPSGTDDRPRISEQKEQAIREGALLFLEGLERTTKKLADRYRARKAPKRSSDEHSVDAPSSGASAVSGGSEASDVRDAHPKA